MRRPLSRNSFIGMLEKLGAIEPLKGSVIVLAENPTGILVRVGAIQTDLTWTSAGGTRDLDFSRGPHRGVVQGAAPPNDSADVHAKRAEALSPLRLFLAGGLAGLGVFILSEAFMSVEPRVSDRFAAVFSRRPLLRQVTFTARNELLLGQVATKVPKSRFLYTVRIENAGKSPAVDIVFVIQAPPGVRLSSPEYTASPAELSVIGPSDVAIGRDGQTQLVTLRRLGQNQRLLIRYEGLAEEYIEESKLRIAALTDGRPSRIEP
jgi:hypothetical protein